VLLVEPRKLTRLANGTTVSAASYLAALFPKLARCLPRRGLFCWSERVAHGKLLKRRHLSPGLSLAKVRILVGPRSCRGGAGHPNYEHLN
jgi:hypothetical protein